MTKEKYTLTNCLNCGKPLSYKQLRHSSKGRKPRFCSQKCNFQNYLKTHPNHQSIAGKKGGASTATKHPDQMRNAYWTLNAQLRNENKKFHDNAVDSEATSLENEGFTVVFIDTKGHSRPDVIAYKNGIIYLMEIKTKKKQLKVVVQKQYDLVMQAE